MNSNTLFRYGILTGLFAVLFVPFIVAEQFFFPFITGKGFAFRIIVEIVFALWIILTLKDPSVRPRKSAVLYALLAFVASLGISTLFAEDPSKAFWSNFERMEGYITILHLAAYFLVASSVLQTQKTWRAFWNTSIGVSVAVALYGVLQLAGVFAINQSDVRLDATFGNATYLAIYMLFNFFLTLVAFFEWEPKKWQRFVYGVALVLQASMVFYTATRGTILGLIGGLFLSGLLFIVFSKGRKTLRAAGAALIALILALSGVFFLARDSHFVRNNDVLSRLASISLQEGHVRFMVWGMAWEGFKDRPLFGWGQEGFNYVFNTYYNPGMYAQEPWFDRAHNVFFDWLIAGGAFGLALYLSLFVIPLWYLWKPGDIFSTGERVLITGLLAGYSFHNLFVFDNLMSYVLFFSLLAYLTSRHAIRRAEGAPDGTPVHDAPFYILSIVVLAVFAATLYTANIPGIARATGIIDGLRSYDGGIQLNFEHYKRAVGSAPLGRQEAHEQLMEFATRVWAQDLGGAPGAQEFKNEVAQFAIDRFDEAAARQPRDVRLRFFYGSSLRRFGLFDGAEEMLDQALALSPQKQTIIIELGILALNRGDVQTALIRFKQAYDLAPGYDHARSLYAATALRLGKRDLADALLIERYGTVLVNDPLILQAYLDTGDSERVVATAKALLADDPDDLQNYLGLAAVYLKTNRRDDAIATLEDAIRRDPSFKEQGEYYISEIRAGRDP